MRFKVERAKPLVPNLSALAGKAWIGRIAAFTVLSLCHSQFIRLTAPSRALPVVLFLLSVALRLSTAPRPFCGMIACGSMSMSHVLPPAGTSANSVWLQVPPRSRVGPRE